MPERVRTHDFRGARLSPCRRCGANRGVPGYWFNAKPSLRNDIVTMKSDDLIKLVIAERQRIKVGIAASIGRLDDQLPPDPRADTTVSMADPDQRPRAAAPLLCKDCRFSELHVSPEEKWICSHRASRHQSPRSLVTGHLPDPVQLECKTARTFEMDNLCGPAGRHWEQR